MPDAKALAKLRVDAERMKAEAERMLSEALQAAEMEKAAVKIQAQFRGRRDRAIVEVKRVRAEFRHRSKAERDLTYAMSQQNSLAGLTEVKAMTAESAACSEGAPAARPRLNSYLTSASLVRACG